MSITEKYAVRSTTSFRLRHKRKSSKGKITSTFKDAYLINPAHPKFYTQGRSKYYFKKTIDWNFKVPQP